MTDAPCRPSHPSSSRPWIRAKTPRALLVLGLAFLFAAGRAGGRRAGRRRARVAPIGSDRHVRTPGATAPLVTRIDAKPAFFLGESSPHPRLPQGPFEVEWHGLILWQDPGPIRLEAVVGGRLRIEVDGVTLLNGEGRATRPGWLLVSRSNDGQDTIRSWFGFGRGPESRRGCWSHGPGAASPESLSLPGGWGIRLNRSHPNSRGASRPSTAGHSPAGSAAPAAIATPCPP
ncbi:MAG: hypothetical protein U0794_03015 [Isosphaeraceae bacterium]